MTYVATEDEDKIVCNYLKCEAGLGLAGMGNCYKDSEGEEWSREYDENGHVKRCLELRDSSYLNGVKVEQLKNDPLNHLDELSKKMGFEEMRTFINLEK